MKNNEVIALLLETARFEAYNLFKLGYSKTLSSLIAKCGKGFEATNRPKWLEGENQLCPFAESMKLALYSGLTYCEGWVFRVRPIPHAWCIDSDGNVFDISDPFQHLRTYVGVPFNVEYLRKSYETQGPKPLHLNPEIYELKPEEFLHRDWINK